MQQIEQVLVPMNRYRDADGNPTCAKDFDKGEICLFYSSIKYASIERCAVAKLNLARRGGSGPLIPCVKCILWSGTRGSLLRF